MQHVRGIVLDQDDEESDEKITKDFPSIKYKISDRKTY